MNALFATGKTLLTLFIASLLISALAYQTHAPVTIDVGSGRDTPFVQGFSFRENFPDGTSFRWSTFLGEIRFWGIGAQEGTLTLRLAAPRPGGTVVAAVLANGQKLGDISPGATFQDYTFSLDREKFDESGNLIVTLASSNTFTAPPDTRNLGLQVDSARFQWGDGVVVAAPAALFFLAALTLLAFVITLVWTGNERAALVAAWLSILLGTLGIISARIETAWFAAPLFWCVLGLFVGAWLLTKVLWRINPQLSPRTIRLLFVAMALALAVRMLWATGPGFITDTQDYVVWSYKTVTFGLGSAYSALNGLWISDQSPGLNYVLHIMGYLYYRIFAPDFLYPAVAGDPALRALSTNPAFLADPVQRTLLRVPQLLADLITGALIFAVARKNLSERGAWLVVFGYWLNPAVLWNGAYWGQTDAIHSLLVLAVFLLMGARRVGWAFFVLGIAALTKPQAAVFAPLLLLWAWRLPPSPILLTINARWRNIVIAIAAGAAGAALTLVPMFIAGGANGMLAYFADTVGHHPILSANAHNLWWLVTRGQIDVADTLPLFPGAPLSARAAGLVLFGLVYLAALGVVWKRGMKELEEFCAVGAYLALAFFMLPTEIHENYGYALLPLLAVALTRDKNLIAFYVAVSATMTLNYALSDPPLFARLGISDPDTQLSLPRLFNAAVNTLIFVAWSIYLFARRAVAIPAPQNLETRGAAQ